MLSSRSWLVISALAVALVYSLPLLACWARMGHLLYVASADETIYSARVANAYRGGTLGNPYFAEHENAPRYMPELVERVLAWTAKALGVAPLSLLAATRVLFPVLIFLLVWDLARRLGAEPLPALAAAAFTTLAPSFSHLRLEALAGGPAGFLRYFRLVSPAAHVVLLLAALRLVWAAWTSGSLRNGALAGGLLGLLFYTPPYYWSFALGGTVLLATWSVDRDWWIVIRDSIRDARCTVHDSRFDEETGAPKGPTRALLVAIFLATCLAVPYAIHTLRMAGLPEVEETLNRFDLMLPGRRPDAMAFSRFLLAVLVLVVVWWRRRRLGPAAAFLLPFLFTGAALFIENVVTNRSVQAYHWVNCLIPVWFLAGALLWQQWARTARPPWVFSLLGALLVATVLAQTVAYARWEAFARQRPEMMTLDALMPQTIRWLDRQTPAGSVVLSTSDRMHSLVLFTHNKVYWAFYGEQHVVSQSEALLRRHTFRQWTPERGRPLPYRADYYLGTDDACRNLPAERIPYRNPAERTCVMALIVIRGS